MLDFLAMGGYGVYVWPTYIIAVGGMVIMLAVIGVQNRRERKKKKI